MSEGELRAWISAEVERLVDQRIGMLRWQVGRDVMGTLAGALREASEPVRATDGRLPDNISGGPIATWSDPTDVQG